MGRRDAGHTPPASPRGPGRAAHVLPTLLVLALLGTSVAAADREWGPTYLGWGPEEPPAAAAGALLPDPAEPLPVAEPVGPAALDPAAVRAAVADGLRDDALGPHVVAAVADLAGGEPVLARGRGRLLPASTTKLLTGVAALAVLEPGTRFRTRVVTGEREGQVVLVGGGDPLLAAEPAPAGTRPARADLTTLAEQAAVALAAREPGRQPVRTSAKVRLRYDTSLFAGPAENPRWRPDYVRDQIVSPIVPLWVDGGRDDSGWGRVEDPARDAAERFAAALRDAGVRVVGPPRPATAPAGATELAAVESAPLDQLVARMVDVSDNETAEVLAHHVGLATSGVGSFEAGAAGTRQALADLGVDLGADELYDGSGLSRDNRLSAATLVAVLRLAASPEHPRLRGVVEGLPVAGFSGSLALRFGEGPPAGPGRVRAKTGTLTGVHALAGLVTDVSGHAMVVVLGADRVPAERSLDARAALDRVAASLAGCSCGAGG
ncbi:D-alanyl-D-alanine carboxypeptidase/D-alanyl-D-alanine-endopeptidase [Nocardioides solisilvae]|uniref:D-alanyl-D-alanine carboxypeptidase/D-alanyl-D-alanine endopeptidase n=1 Tax=Nocardioides solisilvae TaxID=1542435 RepID=UPI000D741972|nr:D-alanyl-D-alanine carboxypeptidase/D-alanyl-D-alanine-endopeptidase [Nocardioides solisilvae]